MWAWLAVVLVVFLGVPAAADEPDTITPPRLSYLDGSVSFWRLGAEQWTAAPLNTALAPGDRIHTGRRGTAELQVGSRAFVRAWGDTELTVVDQAADYLQLKIEDGHVVVDLRTVEPGGIIHLETPGGLFTLERPGYYRVDVSRQATALTTRREGQPPKTTRVEAGGAGHTVTTPPLDAWDRWNQARTDELLHAASARYVPDGTYGVRDLDDHGDWRVLPTYGAVWVPRGAPAAWAPYTTGRWLWDPRFGWTWVDTAVWGWAPFHHGRWVYLDGVWAWAPGPVVARPMYAPALVAFFQAPGVRVTVGAPFVSWVALGWGEPVVPWWGRGAFVGRPAWLGWGGPRVVNNVVVSRTATVHATDIRVYRNTTVHRALVAVAPDRFGRARVEDARVTAVDTRRLTPVRGPLRVASEPATRPEPSARMPRELDSDRGRPDAARPRPRQDAPARTPPASSAPRNERPSPRGPQARAHDNAMPREPAPPAAAPRPEPRLSPAVPATEPARRSEPPSRMDERGERRAAPDRAVRAPREPSDRAIPERRERQERRAPAVTSPSVKGAAARERQERRDERPRRDGRRDGKKGFGSRSG
ncbi:MAG TPA: DUF6600 domain-containing protein [Methylomirabilota bacterium]|jgi:hypothetical protein